MQTWLGPFGYRIDDAVLEQSSTSVCAGQCEGGFHLKDVGVVGEKVSLPPAAVVPGERVLFPVAAVVPDEEVPSPLAATVPDEEVPPPPAATVPGEGVLPPPAAFAPAPTADEVVLLPK